MHIKLNNPPLQTKKEHKMQVEFKLISNETINAYRCLPASKKQSKTHTDTHKETTGAYEAAYINDHY